MCGIIGVTRGRAGRRRCPRPGRARRGLARLEYRGYDSAGVALVGRSGGRACGGRGRPTAPARSTTWPSGPRTRPGRPSAGIGHTRWATHGRPTEENAHPHADCTGRLALVHNGIIENHVELADELIAAGHHLESATDTEVLAHLIESQLAATRPTAWPGPSAPRCGRVRGAFAIAVVHADEPDVIVAARRVSPLILGLADGRRLPGVGHPGHPRAHPRLLRPGRRPGGRAAPRGRSPSPTSTATRSSPTPLHVDWDLDAARKDGYDDFMSKEMHEQPKAVADTLLDRRAARRRRWCSTRCASPTSEFRAIDQGLRRGLRLELPRRR